MKRLIAIGLILFILAGLVACSSSEQTDAASSFYKSFNKLRGYNSTVSKNYKYTDYKEIANLFDGIAFDFEAKDNYLPLIWDDETYDSYGIPAYVGDGRMHRDGEQEAVTSIAAILSASLIGVDKSNQNGKDYVRGLNAFFSEAEGIVLNNPAGSSKTTSMWYLIYPAMLYTQVSMLYSDQETMRQNALTTIDSWFRAYQIMYEDGQDYDYTGFDFTTMTPYRNGIWKEPDCAVGMAMLFKYGFELTSNTEYVTAIIHLMDYIESFFGSPQYELLMYYAPALSAQLNAMNGTDYDITKALNRVFDGTSIPRGGWGSINGTWGDYEVNGLFGSTTDGGGYAFSMNTFVAAGAIAPMLRYDARYATSIGKWLLHVNSNARYYFADETDTENQSVTYTEKSVPKAITDAVPYEGIRNQCNGRSPWFGGDPTVYDWAETDFSLYSGAHTGILGALYEETNQDAVLKVDLLATDPSNDAFPTYLIYNPHDDVREVAYRVSTGSATDLFNTLTNSIVASNVENETTLIIQPDDAAIIVEIPAGAVIEYSAGRYFVNDRYISSDRVTLSIRGAENNDTVSGKVSLTAVVASNFNDEIKQSILTCEDKVITFSDKVTLSAKDFGKGNKQIHIKTVMQSELSDELYLRLFFE